MHAAAAARTVDAAWGHAYLDPAIERTYDRNLLWVVGDGDGLSAEALDAHADRLLGGAGMTHRRLMVEPAADARLRGALSALGYEAGTHLFQVFSPGARAPEPVAGVEVVEASADDVLAATEDYLRTDPDTPYGRDPQTREHLLEHYRSYGPAGADERRFVVRADGGRVAAWARLWVRADGDEAQVEDVVVLAPYRGRGDGRAIVTAATRAALRASPSLLFIVADADDWPKDLYQRLGYATAGGLGVYLRFAPR
jgi:GNAT superfamily N-acetyltransferase